MKALRSISDFSSIAFFQNVSTFNLLHLGNLFKLAFRINGINLWR